MKLETICRALVARSSRKKCLGAHSRRTARPERALVFHRCALLVRREEAQNMVEFALVLPLLLLAVTGVLWFGIALNQYQVLTNAVGSGARAFALSRGQTTVTDPCSYAVTTIEASASTLTASSLTFKVVYTPSSGTSTTYTYPTTCSGLTMNSGDTVQITSTYPITTNVFSFGSNHLTLTAQTSELVQ